MDLVAGLLAFLLAALAARLALLHVGANDALRRRIEQTRRYEDRIPEPRGRILDRHGNILALDLAMKNVIADPREIIAGGHLRFTGMQLARVLQLDPAMVLGRLNRPRRRFEYIKQFVPEDTAEQIRRMQLHGVRLDDVCVRHYPQGELACHVIGFANLENIGSAGIEQRLDAYLRGQPGLRVSEKDGGGREIYDRRVLDIAPQQGADVYLTIDQNLQYLVEKALDTAIAEQQARAAWAIVQRVRTGEILAMASRPAYDLNQYRASSQERMLNRATGHVFEPGSTFKVAVIAAALNEKTVTPDQVFDCENGCWFYKGRPLRDYHPNGRLTVADVLKKSSNIGAAKIALTMDEKTVERYLRAFGFGRPSGIELPGEEGGILHEGSRWSSLSLSRIAMGHEVGVTALQMLNMLCAVANDGFLVRPTIIRRMVDSDGRTIMETKPEFIARPIREDTARLMRKLLARVTEEGGTGTRARVEGYTVAGKTGTAQKAVPGGYSDRANYSSFMGFLPAESPDSIAIMVVLDEPQRSLRTGGVVAGPVFQEIARQAVRYLDIPPDVPAVASRESDLDRWQRL
jgi:cell division protein FtsI (penicillin-binding protein 3)